MHFVVWIIISFTRMGQKISTRPLAAALTGTEYFVIVQNGQTRRTTPTDLQTYLSGICQCWIATSLAIPTASVLTLNATPIQIVAAPGAGLFIEVLSASFKSTFNSVAYATNTTLQVITDTATVAQADLTTGLVFSVSMFKNLARVSSATATATQLIANKALMVVVPTGNPTAGNSDITVYVTYRII